MYFIFFLYDSLRKKFLVLLQLVSCFSWSEGPIPSLASLLQICMKQLMGYNEALGSGPWRTQFFPRIASFPITALMIMPPFKPCFGTARNSVCPSTQGS